MHTQSISGELDGPNMWHFLSVFSALIFSRGEKSAELIFTEQAKQRDLDNLGIDNLRGLINNEVKKSMMNIVFDCTKPNFAKQISMSVD